MNKNITVLKGDGIGPEIVDQAIKVLDAVCKKYSQSFSYPEVDIGGCSIDKHGVPIPKAGMEICKSADSVLLGAVGGPKWDNVDPSIRPEKALLAVRSELGLSESKKTTDDLNFTVETVSCLGACGLAPVITVNDVVHAEMTPEKVVALLNQIKEEINNAE